MPRCTVLLLGLVLLTMLLLEPTGSVHAVPAASVEGSPGSDDGPHPAAPALDHNCVLFGNFFDGRAQWNVNNTGARARIGYPGSAPVNICNPAYLIYPNSASSSWTMMHETSCYPKGYFQVGYIRRNDYPSMDPQKEYFFTEYFSCDDAIQTFRYQPLAQPIGGTSHCYAVTKSGLQNEWIAAINETCGGQQLYKWTFPASAITMNADNVQYFGEVFDFLQAPGANGHNSDSMCGFSYNKCTWQQTQRRDLAGVWKDASTTGYFTPGGHCGYGQVVNNPTSFAIWTNFTGC